jgi:uncharacterized protein (TIGR02271 family)
MKRSDIHSSIDTANLKPLSRLDDFRVAEHDQDVRGWDVIARDGKKIGNVDDLLVDTTMRKVRYLGVDLDRGLFASLFGGGHGGHVLVPIEEVELRSNQVMVNSVASSEASTLPTYDFDTFSRTHNFQRSTLGATGTQARHLDTEREARLTLAEEELAVGKRRVASGEVEVGKRVETERVRETVPVAREEVTVERRPATGMSTAPRIGNDEIRVPISHEEVTVEKRVVPKEELVIKKHQIQSQEVVEADVRRERAEVRHDGEVVSEKETNRRR